MMRRNTTLLFFNVLGIALLAWYGTTHMNGLWFTLDSAIFRFFNEKIVLGSNFSQLVAYANLRVMDVPVFLCMAGLYLYFFLQTDNTGKRKMIALGILMLFLGVLLKQAAKFSPIQHISPTLFFGDANRLSIFTDIGAKDYSRVSFPSDHGTMLMIFAAFTARYFGKRAFCLAALLVIIFTLPRIAGGAHWFSDVYVGSFSLVCIAGSWLLLTPASDILAAQIERIFPHNFFPVSKKGIRG